MTTQLTVLNMMASRDFDTSVARHAEWGLTWMDLWGDIYGAASVDDLDPATAARAADTIDRAGLRVYCLSTRVFNDRVEKGEEAFREEHLGQLQRSLELARILQPTVVRLIAARLTRPEVGANAIDQLKEQYPWVADVYREAVGLIVDAGFAATIENETTDCILADPQEFLDFFAWLGLGDQVSLTWDIQNNWQMGVFPTLAGYRALRPLIGYVHLKGGQARTGSDELAWSVSLADASWPVVEIAQAVVDDGVSPVICLNPSHGAIKPGYDYGAPPEERDFTAITKRDLDFLRSHVRGIVS